MAYKAPRRKRRGDAPEVWPMGPQAEEEQDEAPKRAPAKKAAAKKEDD